MTLFWGAANLGKTVSKGIVVYVDLIRLCALRFFFVFFLCECCYDINNHRCGDVMEVTG